MSWSAQYCEGVNLRNNSDTTFAFFFPDSPGSAGYILRPQGNLSTGQLITATIRIVKKTGEPRFVSYDDSPVPPGNPPNCRFVLHSANDEQWLNKNGRFYVQGSGSRCVPLLFGTFTYSVKLDPSVWTNVDGEYKGQEFDSLLSNMAEIGLCFGGGNSDGHGVYATGGQAKFALKNFTIT